jgi:hypothetical protein
MPRKSKGRKHKRKTKTIRRCHRGGDGEQVYCCMCETIVDKRKTFIPRKCLTKYGQKAAHRICENCWWNEFAEEDAKHACPGCVKGLPLTKYKKETPIVVDLTEN